MKFSIKDFFRKCDKIRRKLRIWSHLLKKSLIENFIFCVVLQWGTLENISRVYSLISAKRVFKHCMIIFILLLQICLISSDLLKRLLSNFFRTLLNIKSLLVVSYLCKTHHLRYLTRFRIYFWICGLNRVAT